MRDFTQTLPSLVLPPPSRGDTALPADDLALVDMHRRFLAMMERGRGTEGDDDAIDAAFDLMDDSADLRPTTLAGALAALAWARWEFGRIYVEEREAPDNADRWTLAMIDGAIDVLRQVVEGGRA